jgi:hypothetical protein
MASTPAAKARTELNVAIGYVDRAARRLAAEPGYLRHARTLERLSGRPRAGSSPGFHPGGALSSTALAFQLRGGALRDRR